MITVFVIGFVSGILIGTTITNFIFLVQTVHGMLLIDQSNPDKDIYRLEIENLDIIPNKKKVILKIDTKSQISQK